MKVLRATWAKHPHPELAELILRADADGNAERAYERVRDTVGPAANHVENAVALARSAIAAQRFDVAREALTAHIDAQPQQRVCALMAQIEDAADDKGRVKEWLARALNAARDPMWVSDGVANMRWVAVSPVTGEIVPCEWKVPFETPQGQIAFSQDVQPNGSAKPLLEARTNMGATSTQVPAPPPADDPGVVADTRRLGLSSTKTG